MNAIAYDRNGVASAPIIQNVEVTIRGTTTTSAATATMEVYAHNGMSYWLYTPANAADNMPLIVYLHGNHSKSDDPSQLVVSDSFSNMLYEGKLGNVPAYVLIPQLNATEKGWISIREDVMDLVNTVAETFLIDRSNISLTGFSIGGSATWTIGAVYHDTFARIAPCAGSVELSDEVLQQLSKLSIWAFIGAEDTVVNPQATRDCAAALSEREASIQVTEYDGVTHTEVPELAYTEPNLVRWLIGQ